MSLARSLKISLAFVGLLVGAGFATGAEVIQYFVSFGAVGILGAAISGLLMTIAGAVVLQLGSMFLADDHQAVFRHVTHPAISRFLDVAVIFTLFAIGFVMLAGAGSTLEQQLGWPTWVGTAIMVGLVLVTGLLDVDKVSSVISLVTPLVIIAVIAAFILGVTSWPADAGALSDLAAQAESPVSPWWLSSLNYTGLALLMGVSMSIVIGGDHANPREAFVGGLTGGALYMVLMTMAAVALFAGFETAGEAEVPMLALFAGMNDWAPWVMVVVIYVMVYNSAIGMLYALGKRLSGKRFRFYPVFAVCTLAAFAVSFVGFDTLMTYVYPVIGYIGMAMIAVLVLWWFTHRDRIDEEIRVRYRLTALLGMKQSDPDDFSDRNEEQLEEAADSSVVDSEKVTESVEEEVGGHSASGSGSTRS